MDSFFLSKDPLLSAKGYEGKGLPGEGPVKRLFAE
jgi:hypothetical protein